MKISIVLMCTNALDALTMFWPSEDHLRDCRLICF